MIAKTKYQVRKKRQKYRLRKQLQRKLKKQIKKMNIDWSAVAKGAAAGATVDAATGGTTLGLGTLTGATVGLLTGSSGDVLSNVNDGKTKYVRFHEYWKSSGGARVGKPVTWDDTNPAYRKALEAEHLANTGHVLSESENSFITVDQNDRAYLQPGSSQNPRTGKDYWDDLQLRAQKINEGKVVSAYYEPSSPVSKTFATIPGTTTSVTDLLKGVGQGALNGATDILIKDPKLNSAVVREADKQVNRKISEWFSKNWIMLSGVVVGLFGLILFYPRIKKQLRK